MARPKTISDADLLEVARQVFVEAGIGAPTKAIARRAGISEGVLFQRFRTKEDLFFAAMVPPVADLSAIFEHHTVMGLELLEKITFSMLNYFRTALPVLVPLMSHPVFRFEDFARQQADSPLVTLRRELMQFMLKQKNEGRIGQVDPGAAALVIWSTAQTVAFFEQLGAHDGRLPDEIVTAAIACLWTGMKPQ